MDLVWSRAAFYLPPKVLGKNLRGFSPFHILMLEAVSSPYIIGGKRDNDDLILAVYICSQGWADRYSIIRYDLKAVKKWGRSVRKPDFVVAHKDFLLYLQESWEMPGCWPEPGSSGIKANPAYHLATFGMRELKMTEQEAWDCPMARLVCYRACVSESEGGDPLITDDDRAGMAILKADQEKADKKKAEKQNG